MISIPESITIPKVIWTACGIVSLVIVSDGLRYWIRLLDAYVKRGADGRSTLQIWGHIIEEALLDCAALLIVASGVFQLTQPPPNPRVPVTPGAIFTVMAVLGIAVILAIHSVVARVIWEMVVRRNESARDRETDRNSGSGGVSSSGGDGGSGI